MNPPNRTTAILDDLAEGAAAGAVATVPMSAAMYAAMRAGLMGEYPPVVIVDALLDALGVERTGEADRALATLAHIGFGAAGGAVFALARRPLGRAIPTWVEGVTFGLLVYGLSYGGWVPAAGFLPEPDDDRPGRQPSMIAAHVVYGGILGALLRRPVSSRG